MKTNLIFIYLDSRKKHPVIRYHGPYPHIQSFTNCGFCRQRTQSSRQKDKQTDKEIDEDNSLNKIRILFIFSYAMVNLGYIQRIKEINFKILLLLLDFLVN